MSDELEKLTAKREALIEFLDSPVHLIYVRATQAQIEFEAERILDDPTTTEKEYLELRAQRRLLKSSRTFFEDAVSTLNEEIEKLVLDEQQKDTQ